MTPMKLNFYYSFEHYEHLIGRPVKDIHDDSVHLIAGINKQGVKLSGIKGWITYNSLGNDYIFIDGSPLTHDGSSGKASDRVDFGIVHNSELCLEFEGTRREFYDHLMKTYNFGDAMFVCFDLSLDYSQWGIPHLPESAPVRLVVSANAGDEINSSKFLSELLDRNPVMFIKEWQNMMSDHRLTFKEKDSKPELLGNAIFTTNPRFIHEKIVPFMGSIAEFISWFKKNFNVTEEIDNPFYWFVDSYGVEKYASGNIWVQVDSKKDFGQETTFAELMTDPSSVILLNYTLSEGYRKSICFTHSVSEKRDQVFESGTTLDIQQINGKRTIQGNFELLLEYLKLWVALTDGYEIHYVDMVSANVRFVTNTPSCMIYILADLRQFSELKQVSSWSEILAADKIATIQIVDRSSRNEVALIEFIPDPKLILDNANRYEANKFTPINNIQP